MSGMNFSELFVVLVPMMLFIIEVLGLPTLILSLIQYHICKNKSKHYKIIPIITGCLSLLVCVGSFTIMYALMGAAFKLLYLVVYTIFSFLPLVIVLLITKYTKKRIKLMNFKK